MTTSTTANQHLTLNSNVSSIGGSGQFLTTSGINGVSWTTSTTAVNSVLTVNQGNPATLEVKGNIVMNGVDLDERLKTIEKILMIPERDVKLETKYPKLKKLYNEYINELSKYRMWESIKDEK